MKGSRINQFTVGEKVSYPASFVAVSGKNENSPYRSTGTISKLHKSGTFGIAEIFPDNGEKKISRRLQFVEKE